MTIFSLFWKSQIVTCFSDSKDSCTSCSGPGAFLSNNECYCDENVAKLSSTGDKCLACTGPGSYIQNFTDISSDSVIDKCACYYPSILNEDHISCECLSDEYQIDEKQNICVPCAGGNLINGTCACDAKSLLDEETG